MLITDFIKSLRGCRHDKVRIDSEGSYCPDCGKFVKIKWYIVRCSCCGVKRVACLDLNDNVRPVDKFCPNCGDTHTFVEEVPKINFVDIHFAVHKKEVSAVVQFVSSTQFWAETDNSDEQLLIGLKT